jgi:Biotin carboxyl carrier protein
LINQTDIAEVALESAGVKVSIRKKRGRDQFRAACPGARGFFPERILPRRLPYPGTPLRRLPRSGRQREKHGYGRNAQNSGPHGGDLLPVAGAGGAVLCQCGRQGGKRAKTLCIVEAMKLMNEIESDVAGEVVDILVENAGMVEYGQIMFVIRPVN